MAEKITCMQTPGWQGPMLSAPEVAKRLGLSRGTVYNLLKANELPYYRFGGSIRISEWDVDKFLQDCRSEWNGPNRQMGA